MTGLLVFSVFSGLLVFQPEYYLLTLGADAIFSFSIYDFLRNFYASSLI